MLRRVAIFILTTLLALTTCFYAYWQAPRALLSINRYLFKNNCHSLSPGLTKAEVSSRISSFHATLVAVDGASGWKVQVADKSCALQFDAENSTLRNVVYEGGE